MPPGMTHRAKLLSIAFAAAVAASPAPLPRGPARVEAAPRRIVSVDLCADQLVLALADRTQIAGLSRFATDPALSAGAARATGLPTLNGSAEALVVARPDMIVAVPAPLPGATAMLDPTRYRSVAVPDAVAYPAIVAQLRTVGAAVGRSDRAEALVRRMDARLAALPRNPGGGRVAAYYQRRGYMTGTGTLVDDLMRRAGLINLAGRLGKPVLAQLSLEELVAARPDYLILEADSAAVIDQGTEMLHHPALRHIPRLWIPQAWTVCGTPDYVLAAESLARQLAAPRRRR